MTADLELARRLLAEEHGLAVVATTRADGSVHASVVNAGFLPDPHSGDDRVGIVVRGSARKLAHLRRSGRATVVARRGREWVAVEGPVLVVGPDDPAPGYPPEQLPGLLRGVFTAAGGTHDDWPTYDRVMAEERRAVVLVTPRRITTNR